MVFASDDGVRLSDISEFQPPPQALSTYVLLWIFTVTLLVLSFVFVVVFAKFANWQEDPFSRAAMVSGVSLTLLAVGALLRRFLLPAGDYIVVTAYAALSAAMWWRIEEALRLRKRKHEPKEKEETDER